jgi:acyl-CoA reductase-like NAD-dependent aldehyde dehydrogenase
VVNGQLKGADRQYHGINPFTEEKLWPAPVATEQDLEEAVVAGNAAFNKWQHTPREERTMRFKEFADDLKRAERIAMRLEAGSVWVNRGVQPLPTALFGGIKQSGLGGEWGPLGMLNYCNARTFHFSKKS